MRGSIVCECCGHIVSTETTPECDYCGYVNIGSIGRGVVNNANIVKYRRDIIKKLRSISIVSYQYGWNEDEAKYMMLAEDELELADGEQCDGIIFWAPHKFGQVFESDEGVTLEIKYIYDGKVQTENYKLKPVQCESFWQVGVEVNEHLKLVFYLGNVKQYEHGGEVPFIRKR